jgi:hypothetical protein
MEYIHSWEHAVIDAYKPMPYHKGWKKCKRCHEIPRIWEFNNGNNAKCRCSNKYDEAQAVSESVLSYIKRHKGSALHYQGEEELRLAWNKYVETGEKQTKLPEGQW